ncbi:hypothetical protein EJB05_44806 [Eragrostis curvula]|uniref:PGG domain-containing protein n=1 Tax=Eragrostis curvula TaxID=38414 RepID=A0A5J9TIM0_9POAL|nr:hypothetical protein EJB05_44806 [Eragrostis curvula]
MSERLYHAEAKVVTLMLTTVVDLASLTGAYIAGSTRYASSCVFFVAITCVAFVGVMYTWQDIRICIYAYMTTRLRAKFKICSLQADAANLRVPLEQVQVQSGTPLEFHIPDATRWLGGEQDPGEDGE